MGGGHGISGHGMSGHGMSGHGISGHGISGHHGASGGGYIIKRGPHGILKVKKKFMIPHSHNIPLLDHAGRAPHHGHLILHHRIK